jgi:tetratricopeptide (TPR) repeat protein
VGLRVCRHGETTRVVFVGAQGVGYSVAEEGRTVRLVLYKRARIDAARLAAALPALAPKVEEADGETRVVLTLPSGARLSHFRNGKDVVLDIKAAAEAKSASPVAQHAPTPLSGVVPPGALAAGKTAPAPAPTASPSPTPQAPAAEAPASLAVHYLAEGGVASLRFDWPVSVAAAVYRRGPAVWIVFSTPTRLELTEPRVRGTQVLRSIEQVPDAHATVLRLVPQDGINPSVRRAGTAWIIDLKNQPAQPDTPISLEVRPSARPPAVFFRVSGATAPVRLRDPEAGDDVLVVPVAELGLGVGPPAGFVDFRALSTIQGVVLRPNADGLVVRNEADGVEVTRPGGLVLSSERDRLLGAEPGASRLFDFAAWRGPQSESFLTRRSELEQAAADAPAGGRSKPRLDLAHFYFANLFGAEAMGVLQAIGRDDPKTAGSPPVQALMGAACLLAHELGCAAKELGRHTLDGEPEMALWRGSLAADKADWTSAAQDFTHGASLLPHYPKPLRNRFALQAAEAMLDTNQGGAAVPLLQLVLKDDPSWAERAMALYLQGRREQAAGHLDRAFDLWHRVAGMDDRPSRARALYSTAVALFDAGKADRAATIKALDRLRFAWRGGEFEFKLLRRLGTLKLAAGDHRGGLEALQAAATDFPDLPEAKEVAKQFADAFANVFLGKGADDVPPVEALAFYDEFHDAMPADQRRDAIVKELVDRLVAVDLLDRAATLLSGQVAHRLVGLDKARAATELVMLRLFDHQPDAAIKALDIDIGRTVPADLARQREQLRARALFELGRSSDALAILANDTSRDADRLRADIYWHDRNWKEVAKVLARLAPAPSAGGKLDGEASRLVLSWAAALTLDGDRNGLDKLSESYGKAMALTPQAHAFRLLADDGSHPVSGDLRQIASQVAQIGELQSFMASYKQRLSGKKLSIN